MTDGTEQAAPEGWPTTAEDAADRGWILLSGYRYIETDDAPVPDPWVIVNGLTDRRQQRCGYGFDSVDWCTRPAANADGECLFHQRRGNGTEVRDYDFQEDECGVDICDRKPHSKSLCQMHYRRQSRGAQLITLREQRIWDMEVGI